MTSRFARAALLTLASALVALYWRGPSRSGADKERETSGSAAEEELAEAARENPLGLLVDFRDDVAPETLAANPYREEPVSRFSALDRLYRIRFATPEDAARAAEALRRDPSVESVDYDVSASIPPDETLAPSGSQAMSECATAAESGFPDDPCFHYQWHMRQVGLPDAWKLGQGRGATVAIIDTGVTRVPDLAKTRFVDGYNFVADNDQTADDHGHGTHVAGTVAQATHNRLGVTGVAWGATIMPLKVLSAQGSGSMGGIAQAIRFAADHGASVINMSLGGPFPVSAIRSAVAYARSRGVTVVAAAGNNGNGRVSYPARYPGVIAVASTQFDETTTFYSNWGKAIDIAAPGGNVRVDQNGDGKPDGVLQNTVVPGDIKRTDYLWFMGTSMASPHVAGVAALLVGAGVTRPEAVESILLGTARRPKTESTTSATSGRIDDHYGAGIVDAKAALTKARLGRGAGGLGLATLMAWLCVGSLRRRGVGMAAGLLTGASGLFVLPWLFSGAPDLLSVGAAETASLLFGAGNPLVWSAALPVGLAALLYGVGKAQPVLAGFAFGIAGALAFAAIAYPTDISLVPDVLDRAWLAMNAVVSAGLGTLVLRR